jgi:plastocyanin
VKWRCWAPLLLAVALILAACGGPSDGVDGAIAGQNVTVEMYDNRYQFTEVKIPVGGSVDWLGAGRNPHNTVAADGSWSTENEFGSLDQFDGDSAVVTYDQAGTYIFFCTYHGNAEGAGMAGVLMVEDE